MQGAVPTSFFKTLQVLGTSACLAFRSIIGRFSTLANMCVTCASVAASTTILPLKYWHNKGFVISSAVGPKPPVISIILANLLSWSNAFQISSQVSPTATLCFTATPILFNSCAIQGLFVSIT